MSTAEPPLVLEKGQRWRHYKGASYCVITLAQEEATGQEVVVYQHCDSGQIWTRPRIEFAPPRFVPLPA